MCQELLGQHTRIDSQMSGFIWVAESDQQRMLNAKMLSRFLFFFFLALHFSHFPFSPFHFCIYSSNWWTTISKTWRCENIVGGNRPKWEHKDQSRKDEAPFQPGDQTCSLWNSLVIYCHARIRILFYFLLQSMQQDLIECYQCDFEIGPKKKETMPEWVDF